MSMARIVFLVPLTRKVFFPSTREYSENVRSRLPCSNRQYKNGLHSFGGRSIRGGHCPRVGHRPSGMYSSSTDSESCGVLKYRSNANGKLTRARIARVKIMIFPFVNGRRFCLTTEQYQEPLSIAVVSLALFGCPFTPFLYQDVTSLRANNSVRFRGCGGPSRGSVFLWHRHHCE